ncbi:MAG: tRNA (adenosine(37)-N6)-dimethylallyltransferase MiaA [bacterium]
MNKVIVICGPTATGKSAFAVDIAKRYNGEIISADSRQVYRGLDIGSAKITPAEMQSIPHHLIDVANPRDTFTVTQFKKLADEKITHIISRGKVPIMCGGTGMYISAVIDNQEFPEVPPDEQLRSELEQRTAPELFDVLLKLDPIRADTIDKNNPVRLIRAIEIAQTLGSVPTQATTESPYDVLMIGLRLPKDELDSKIVQRINQRIPGLFTEIRNLHTQSVSSDQLRRFGLEYRYGDAYVTGKILLDEFIETLTTKTIQFAKRQMTWFKRDARIHWLNPISDHQKILKLIQDFLK